MALRSTKNRRIISTMAVPDKGLDLSGASVAIHDNALTRAYNFWYEPNMTGLVTRYGLTLADAPPLRGAVSMLHYHVDSKGTGHFLACTSTQNGTDALYRLAEHTEAASPLWEKVTDLHTEKGHAPGLLSFNGVLLIADGRGAGLAAWDGEKVTDIPKSPTRPTVLTSVADRVVCNSLDAPDAVFFSEPEQHTGWDVSEGGAALIVPAGFGDGMDINALSNLYGMLVVSKIHKDAAGNITQKRLHAISTLGTPTSWSGLSLSQTSSAVARGAMTGVADRVYFLDSDGPQSLLPSPGGAYGDIAIDPKLGPKIHPLIAGTAQRATEACVQWVRNLSQLWFIVRNGAAATVAVWHPLQNGGAWTELQFPMAPRSLCEVGDRVYIAGDDGRIYWLTPTGTDWTPDGEKPIFTTLRTKKYTQMGGDLVLKGVKVGVGRLLPALLRVEAVDEDDTRYLITETTTRERGSADQKIYDATANIESATWKIYGGENPVPQYFDWKCRIRRPALFLQLRTVGGRICIDNISGVWAVVG